MRYIITLALSILPVQALCDVPKVVVDIPPVYGLVQSVLGDLGQPILLLQQGSGAHDLQLRPSQMADVTSSDLVVWIGPDLTPALQRIIGRARASTLLDVSQTQLLQAVQGHGHDDDHGHEEEHAGNDEGSHDPHAWLSPENAGVWLDAIAKDMAGLDPENAAQYAANAAAAKDKVAALDAELTAELAPVAQRGFVAGHDSLRYFAQHYGLDYRGAVALGDATAAGAAHVQQVRSALAQDVVCAFPDAGHDTGLLAELVVGTPAKLGGPLDPEGATLNASASAYHDTLRNLASTLKDCLAVP